MNRIAELRKKLGLTQTRLGEEIGVSQQTISKYENGDENIPGDMLLALSKFFRVPIDYILRKEEEQQQREQNDRKEIMELYRDMDQYNRDTWIIIGKSFEAEQGMIFVEKYRGKLEWLNSISLAELQRKIGEIYFVDHYKMIADQFLYKKDFETSLFLRIAMETGIRSADIPCIEWSCMHGKTIILEETKRGDLYKKVNGTFPKISTQSLRIMKLLHRKQGKIFTKSNEYYVRKISCAWGMPGFRIHSFRDYRRKIEMGITAGVQVPRIIPL